MANADHDPLALGKALRARRKELRRSMQSVADDAGLSVGFISQVERGLTAPSLGSLASIASALNCPVSAFLDQPGRATPLTRGKGRQRYTVPGAQKGYERISTSFEGSRLHSVIVHEPPGHRAEPISHQGEEMLFVLRGAITVELDGTVAVLTEGDSIHFDSRRTHSTWNHTTEAVSLLWCGTMDVFGDAPDPLHQNTPTHSTGED
ncbi:MAG: cupin domain-containing protein [Pseudomonadota bacterium]